MSKNNPDFKGRDSAYFTDLSQLRRRSFLVQGLKVIPCLSFSALASSLWGKTESWRKFTIAGQTGGRCQLLYAQGTVQANGQKIDPQAWLTDQVLVTSGRNSTAILS